MKKIYLKTILLLLVLTNIHAQPIFTAAHCFQKNDSAKIGVAIVNQTFESYLGTTGSNYNWDFTNAGTPGPWTTWSNPTVSYTFKDALQSSHTLFNKSQINEYANLAFARDLFYTYSTGNDTLYVDGYYTSTNYQYKPRIPYLSFPLSFSDSVYTRTIQYGHPTQPNFKMGSITRKWKYDGFGTLKMPYGNNTNVYRIRTTQIDSSYILKSGTVYEELIWFRQSDGIPVLRFLKNGTSITVYYASAETPSGLMKNSNSTNINLHPNPFNEFINIAIDKPEIVREIAIYSIQGQLQIQLVNPKNLKISTDNLKQGLYFVRVIFEDQTSLTSKLVKN